MQTTQLTVRDGTEFIRILFADADFETIRVTLDGHVRCVKGVCYIVPVHIPQLLLAEEWLVACPTQFPGSTQYTLNPEREYEWQRAEEARIRAAQQILEDRYHLRFTGGSYAALVHPACTNHDARGFLFHDEVRNGYLVMEGGGVIHVSKTIIL